MTQNVFHAYKDGVYIGVHVATDEQFAATGLTAGVEPLPYAPTRKEQEAARAAAYNTEADPLFFKAQRGEATLQEWLALVAEIKARFPYPAE
jgi:hypothetical protein